MKFILLNMRKASKNTLFNLIGLSISFAAVLILSIYIYNEYTFDQTNEHLESLYILNMEIEVDGEIDNNFYLPNPMADAIFENTSVFESSCSFAWGSVKYTLESDPDKVYSISTRAVDSTFTDLFTLKIKWGIENPLKEQDRIIISEETATKIFGDKNPVGQVLLAGLHNPYIIDAVYFDLPPNSSIRYEAFCSFPTSDWINDWSEYSFNHFFKLHKNANLQTAEDEIDKIPAKEAIIKQYPNYTIRFKFLPLKNVHFHPSIGQGNKLFVNIMVGVCFMVLLMAFINYINFGIANAPKRAKSLAARRILGETKARLTLLLSLESAFLISLSFAIALLISKVVFAHWPNILGYEIELITYSHIIIIFFALLIIAGVLFSLIPTYIILKAKPIQAIKGSISLAPKNSFGAKTLTVLQYTISIILIIGLLFLQKQIQYMKNYDLGFDKENILVVETTDAIRQQHKAFAEDMLKSPNITDYAYSQFVPGSVAMGWGRKIEGKQVNFKCWPVDERYLDFMGFEIVDGRAFSNSIEADENSFIFNQKALSEFEWTDDYLGKIIPGFDFKGPLIGVVKDVKYASLHEDVQPMAFWLTQKRKNRLSLKINNRDVANTIKHIEQIYKQFEPKIPISYSFLDESLNDQYKAEEKQTELISIFCFISILISAIGALGLIIFMCELKVKEIGIRKINGATTFQVVNMLNMNLLKCIVVSFIIALPIAYYLVNRWLEGFAYKTSMSWWVFVLSGAIAFVVSLLIITNISYKAAIRNPLDSLRYE